MITLILDAAYNLRVTILKDDMIVIENKSDEKVADKFMFMIDQAVKEAGLSITNIDKIALNIGPGSFTGLRVAASVVKGLAFRKNVEIFTFTSFDYISANDEEAIVIPAFSSYVYVKYKDGKMDCVDIDSLNNSKFVTCFDGLYNELMHKSKSVKLKNELDSGKILLNAKKISCLSEIVPMYLRKSQAEIALEEKQKRK